MQQTPRKPDRPIFWIVAGPNGCGKSSLYNRSDIEGWGGSVWIINPDLLTVKIIEQEYLVGNDANLAAVERIELWLEASIKAYQTIGVETVLSSAKYRRLVTLAHAAGFEVRMIYVVLRSVELQARRIAIRVAEGGHDVPEAKVSARRQRSFEQFVWFLDKADQCYVYDNSTGEPGLIAVKQNRRLSIYKNLPTDLLAELVRQNYPLTRHLR